MDLFYFIFYLNLNKQEDEYTNSNFDSNFGPVYEK